MFIYLLNLEPIFYFVMLCSLFNTNIFFKKGGVIIIQDKIKTDLVFAVLTFFFFKNFVLIFFDSTLNSIFKETILDGKEIEFFSTNLFFDKINLFFCFMFVIKTIFCNKFSFYNKYNNLEITASISVFLISSFFIKTYSFLYAFFCFLSINFLIYTLVFFNKNPKAKHETTIKYFYLSTISSCFLGYATWMIFDSFSCLNMLQINCLLLNLIVFFNLNKFVFVVLITFATAFFFKLAIFPLHFWTPEIYKASNQNLVFFLGVPVKIIFFFFLTKTIKNAFILTTSLQTSVFLFSALLSLILGALGALYEKSWKSFFAYTSINQIGLIFLTVNFINFSSTSTILYFFLLYFIACVLFFFCLGEINLQKNSKQIDFMDQLFCVLKKQKHVFYIMCFCMFSFAGIPVFGGFYAKYFLFSEAFFNKNFLFLIFMLCTGLLSSYYYISVIKKTLFENNNKFCCFKNKTINLLLPAFSAILLLWSFFHSFMMYFIENELKTFFF